MLLSELCKGHGWTILSCLIICCQITDIFTKVDFFTNCKGEYNPQPVKNCQGDALEMKQIINKTKRGNK